MIIRKLFSIIVAAIALTGMAGCDDDKQMNELSFVGDSLVARWDLQESFPFLVTYNHGLSGAPLDYLTGFKGRFTGTDIAVLIGTNNINTLAADKVDEFCDRYTRLLREMDARHIYLLAIPPRNFSGDKAGCNALIAGVNEGMRRRTADDPAVTFIDINTPLLREGTLNPEFSLDGLHLNIYGYEVVAKLLSDAL